jgi:hypothetical protein
MTDERKIYLLNLRIQKLIRDKQVLTKENALLRYQINFVQEQSLAVKTTKRKSHLFGW